MLSAEKKTIRNFSFLLFLISFVIYSNTLNFGYVLDDFSVITENKITQGGIASIPSIFSHFYRYGHYEFGDGLYRPLSVAMFAIEWQISPNTPSLSHFVNVLFYALTCLLLFRVLIKLFNSTSLILPLLISLLFSVHPIHTEVVANIKSRDEIMALFFTLLSIYFLLQYFTKENKIKLLLYSLSLLGAYFSKESSLILVFLIPIIIYYFSNVTRNKSKLIIIVTSCLSGIFLLIRYVVLQKNGFGYEVSTLENPLVSLSWFERFPTVILVLANYISILFFPFHLKYDYSFNQIPLIDFQDWRFLISFTLIFGILIYTIWMFNKKKIDVFGFLIFLLSAGLISNVFFTTGVIMAERLMYFSSIGFSIFLSILILKLVKGVNSKFQNRDANTLINERNLLLACIIPIFLLFSFKTYTRNLCWKSNISLFETDLPVLQKNAKAHLLFGVELIKKAESTVNDSIFKEKLLSKGIQEVLQSKQLFPNYLDTWTILGNAFQMAKKYNEAIYHFKGAQNIDSTSSNGNLGDIYFTSNKINQALYYYAKEIHFHPNSLKAYINLGICYATQKKYDTALTILLKGHNQHPTNSKLNLLIATVYKTIGDEANFLKFYSLSNQISK
jgi:hypothetical protein